MSSRRSIAIGLSVGLLALALPAAQAQDSWGGSLGITSDYRVRGISQTRGQYAIQGGLHVQLQPGWSVGAWASTIDRSQGRSANAELDVYTGFAWAVAPDWDAKVAFTHYWYVDDPARANYDYDEFSASLTYRSQLSATVAWSPESRHVGRYQGSWHSQGGSAVAYELTGLHPLTTEIALNAGVGYYDLSELFEIGYWYWNAGVSYAVGPVQFDVSRIDSDAPAERLFGATATDARWSAAVSWRF